MFLHPLTSFHRIHPFIQKDNIPAYGKLLANCSKERRTEKNVDWKNTKLKKEVIEKEVLELEQFSNGGSKNILVGSPSLINLT